MITGESSGWRHVRRPNESQTAAWGIGIALVTCVVAIVGCTRVWWVPGIARALVCNDGPAVGDAILVDNFDLNYLLFERAAALQASGVGPRVLVPTAAAGDSGELNIVSQRIVGVMADVARLRNPELIPIRESEPIALNAAYQIRRVLQKEAVRSVVVVSPAFRSRRSSLIYQAVFGEARIATRCVPVFGRQSPDTWTDTWHGIQQVAEQHVKLQYYRFYVLPWRMRPAYAW